MITGTKDFVERILSELGELAGQSFASAFRNTGAIGKGVRDVLGRSGTVIGCLHIGHFLDIAKKRPRKQRVIQLGQQRSHPVPKSEAYGILEVDDYG